MDFPRDDGPSLFLTVPAESGGGARQGSAGAPVC